MAAEYVTVPAKDGGQFRAFLATPKRAGKPVARSPGIVLCHESFGVNQTMRDLATLFAEEGYVVLVPDLYWRYEPGIELGYTPGDWQRGFALAQSFNVERGLDDIDATLNVLRERADVEPGVAQAPTPLRGLRRLRLGGGGSSNASTAGGPPSNASPVPEDGGGAGASAQPASVRQPGGVGLVGYGLGGRLAFLAACRLADVACTVAYYPSSLDAVLNEARELSTRLVVHFAENDRFCNDKVRGTIVNALVPAPNVELYTYPGTEHGFARHGVEHFDRVAAGLAHQRTMAALKREMGPYYDLAALFDRHRAHETSASDVEALLATMVPEPYVNYVPTMTGGVGRKQLREFYARHFGCGLPPDLHIAQVSRTVGATQVVDESLFRFTHTCEIEWMLPGIAPTQRHIEIPVVAIARFRGEQVWYKHIYWDQASVLVQIGKLEPDGLPVAGIETAKKMLNENQPSNTLLKDTPR